MARGAGQWKKSSRLHEEVAVLEGVLQNLGVGRGTRQHFSQERHVVLKLPKERAQVVGDIVVEEELHCCRGTGGLTRSA